MAGTSDDRSPRFLLTDMEVEEFRMLARDHAGADLTRDEAQSVAGQLVRLLAIVRAVATKSSSASASSVDSRGLPDAGH